MARKKRPWYARKTNWAIIIGVIAEAMTCIVPLMPYAHIAFTVAGALGAYGIADRAGHAPEED